MRAVTNECIAHVRIVYGYSTDAVGANVIVIRVWARVVCACAADGVTIHIRGGEILAHCKEYKSAAHITTRVWVFAFVCTCV